MEDFSKYKIKDYKYWTLYIHQNQGYLGRCIIWCNGGENRDLADVTPEERDELFVILKNLKDALKRIFKPDWLNYAFLGNENWHLHGHFVPRYASTREFGGVTFKDERWGHNWQTDNNFKIPEDLMQRIKLKIQKELG